MTAYFSTYIVNATPMSRGEYNKHRGWKLPAGECPSDSGYLVSNIESGTESWVTKALFESSTYELESLEGLFPYQRRLIGERAYLKGMLRKLDNALKKPGFLSMPYAERQLLISQARAMTQYLSKLNQRIEAFLPEE